MPPNVQNAFDELNERHVQLRQAFRTVSGYVLAELIDDGKLDRCDLLQRLEASADCYEAELECLSAPPTSICSIWWRTLES